MDSNKKPRKWIGVTFSCCQLYGRAYFDANKNEYQTRCPKCGRWIRFVVGPEGSSQRFFEVS